MQSTFEQSSAAARSYWLTRGGAFDVSQIGNSALGVKDDYDQYGAIGSLNQTFAASLAAGNGGYVSGNAGAAALDWRPEDQADAGIRITDGQLYSSLTTSTSDPCPSWPIIETGFYGALWPLQLINKQFSGTPGQPMVTVASTDKDFAGFPSLETSGVVSNRTHTTDFYTAPIARALLLWVTSSSYNPSAPFVKLPGYANCGAFATSIAQQLLGLTHWELYGGTDGYYTTDTNGVFIAPSNGSGGYLPGAMKLADDLQQQHLTHRFWYAAGRCILVYQLCQALGIPGSDDLPYWYGQYLNTALGKQVTTVPAQNTIDATLPVQQTPGWFPEYPNVDGVGWTMSYGFDSIMLAEDCFAWDTDRDRANGLIAPAIDLALGAALTAINQTTGEVKMWGDLRVNGYTNGQGQITGEPVEPVPNSNPQAWYYSGENDPVNGIKTPPFQPITISLTQWGSFKAALAGGDTLGLIPLGELIAAQRSYGWEAPTGAVSVSPPPPPPPPAQTSAVPVLISKTGRAVFTLAQGSG